MSGVFRHSAVVISLGLATAGVAVVLAFHQGGLMNTFDSRAEPSTGDRGGNAPTDDTLELATFGSGCFWCTEAIFLQLQGVRRVVSGYSGGDVKNPTYEEVCTGTTGHAEVVQVTYDPREIQYQDLLEAFWSSHDPTTPNRQGNDVGTQYRSVIFYHNDQQRALAEQYRRQLEESAAFSGPIVTEIVPFTRFYPAEDYHQDYYRSNPRQQYCQYVIRPKIEKFRKAFADRLKQ